MNDSLFDTTTVKELSLRIESLDKDVMPEWGRMDAAQMLAHLNVQYLYAFQAHKLEKPSKIKQFVLRNMLLPQLISPTPYKKNLPTSKVYKVIDERDFNKEKKELLGNLERTRQMGSEAFEGKEHLNFGKLSAKEWDRLLRKHIEHHLTQFGV